MPSSVPYGNTQLSGSRGGSRRKTRNWNVGPGEELPVIYTDCGIQIYHSHAAQPAEIVAAKSQDYHQTGNLDEYKPSIFVLLHLLNFYYLLPLKDLWLVNLEREKYKFYFKTYLNIILTFFWSYFNIEQIDWTLVFAFYLKTIGTTEEKSRVQVNVRVFPPPDGSTRSGQQGCGWGEGRGKYLWS